LGHLRVPVSSRQRGESNPAWSPVAASGAAPILLPEVLTGTLPTLPAWAWPPVPG